MRTEIVDCDLCGSSEYTVVWDKYERKKKGLLNSIIVEVDGVQYNGLNVQCNNCGLVYVRERLTEKEMLRYYEKEYRETYKARDTAENTNAVHALQYLDQCRVKTCKSLDVGCSSGFFLRHLNANNFDAHGIEVAKEPFEKAVKLGLKVYNKSLNDYDGKDYGLVTILNTLEHIHSPKQALEKIRKLLIPEGLVFVVVPDLRSNILKTTADGFMSNAHLYTFDLHTIRMYLEVTGFQPVYISVSDEPFMQKLYIIAQKVKKKELVVSVRPRPDYLKTRLSAVDFLVRDKFDHMQGEAGYEIKEEEPCQKNYMIN